MDEIPIITTKSTVTPNVDQINVQNEKIDANNENVEDSSESSGSTEVIPEAEISTSSSTSSDSSTGEADNVDNAMPIQTISSKLGMRPHFRIKSGVDYPQAIKNLVIGGGGTAGYCYAGAVIELFKNGGNIYKLDGIRNFIGTSIGALISTILSITQDMDVFLRILESIDISKLRDNSFGVVRNMYRMYKKLGNYKGNYMLNKTRDILNELTGDPDLTFEKHYTLTKNNLIITGVNTVTRQVVYFNRLTHPDLSIVTAVRASISLPLIFVPVMIESSKFTKILGKGGLYIDGGIGDNYPIQFILSDLYRLLNRKTNDEITDAEISEALYALYRYNHMSSRNFLIEMREKSFRFKQLSETIGMKTYSNQTLMHIAPDLVKSDDDIEDEDDEDDNSRTTLKSHVSDIVSIFMDNDLKPTTSHDILKRTVAINVGSIDTTKFDITKDDATAMLEVGKKAMVEHLEKKLSLVKF